MPPAVRECFKYLHQQNHANKSSPGNNCADRNRARGDLLRHTSPTSHADNVHRNYAHHNSADGYNSVYNNPNNPNADTNPNDHPYAHHHTHSNPNAQPHDACSVGVVVVGVVTVDVVCVGGGGSVAK